MLPPHVNGVLYRNTVRNTTINIGMAQFNNTNGLEKVGDSYYVATDVNEAVKYATKILSLNSPCFFGSQKEYFEFIKGGEQNA